MALFSRAVSTFGRETRSSGVRLRAVREVRSQFVSAFYMSQLRRPGWVGGTWVPGSRKTRCFLGTSIEDVVVASNILKYVFVAGDPVAKWFLFLQGKPDFSARVPLV